MLGYRKHAFRRAHTLLRAIELDRNDLDSVKILQLLLIHEIKLAEKRVRELKSENRQLEKLENTRKRKSLESRISKAQDLIYTWKCFGDGIAFLYLDKYALKHTYLHATNCNPKQTAGFLLDKSGFENEWKLLESALASGVPAILADLTNTIRHGDICLLGASDPYLIEVKSSKTKNNRAKRQKNDLTILQDFFENDYSNRLRGITNVYREESVLPEIGYSENLNAAIKDCLSNDIGVARPETGLVYIALRTAAAKIDEAFSLINLERPLIFSLNDAKLNRDWSPYFPFTLTIRDFDHLWSFVRGDIYLMIFVCQRQMEIIGSRNGYSATFDAEDDCYPLSVILTDDGNVMRIASQALARIGMECVSPDWIISNSLAGWTQLAEKVKNDPRYNKSIDKSIIDPILRKYMDGTGLVPPSSSEQ